MIEVNPVSSGDPMTFEVTVNQGGGQSRHQVTLTQAQLQQLCPGKSAEECLEASFRFLLDREPKEAIMAKFDISVISRYFPEYGSKIGEYL
jgi:hypothetical protein